MSAKIIFVVVAAAVAIGSAVVVGLIAAVVGLAAKMPTPALVTITTEAAAAAFGGVIALAGIGAGLFFKASAPVAHADTDKPDTAAGRDDGSGSAAPRPGSSRSGAASDSELRAAVEAHALILKAPPAELHKRPGSAMRDCAADGQPREGLAWPDRRAGHQH
jgi:hypothetical protein